SHCPSALPFLPAQLVRGGRAAARDHRAGMATAPHAWARTRREGGMTAEPLLKIEKLRKFYDIRRGMFSRLVGQVQAVNDVSFEIGSPEVLGLAGASGSAKTTLPRAALR